VERPLSHPSSLSASGNGPVTSLSGSSSLPAAPPLALPESELTVAATMTPDKQVAAPGSGAKRRFHTRTVSDPQFFLKFLSGSSSTEGKSSSMGSMTPASASVPVALPTAPPVVDARATNPTSPKNSLMRSLSMRKKTVESEGLSTNTAWYEDHIKLRVHVKAEMEFNLLDESAIHHRLASIKATYLRTFCLVDTRCFACDQGNIVLRVTSTAQLTEEDSQLAGQIPEEDVESETGTLVQHSSLGDIMETHREEEEKLLKEEEDDEYDSDLDYNEL
jgi:hypothetical protein